MHFAIRRSLAPSVGWGLRLTRALPVWRSAYGDRVAELTYWSPEQVAQFTRDASAVLARGVALGVIPSQSAATLRWNPEYEQIGLRLTRVLTHLVDLHDPIYAERLHPDDRGRSSAVVSQQLAWIDPKLSPCAIAKAELRRISRQPGGAQRDFASTFDHFLSAVEAECSRRELLRPPRPRPRLSGVTPRAAEHLVCEWMQHLGLNDAAVTQQSDDGGVDVTSRLVVAQVKHYAAPVGVDPIRSLHGVAIVSRRRAAFFTLTGYTRRAVEFADSAQMPLFIYSPPSGSLAGANSLGQTCLTAGFGALAAPPG